MREACEPCECGSEERRSQCCHAENEEGVPLKQLYLAAIENLNKLATHLILIHPSLTTLEKREKFGKFMKSAYGEYEETILKSFKVNDHSKLSGKLNVLKKLLPVWKKENHKVLLFSNRTKVLDIIENFLKLYKFSFLRLDGKTPAEKRQPLVDTFNNTQQHFLFIMTTKVGGLGLNLTSASIVVVFDPNWNVSWDLQAQDRVYRIGQTKDTRIFRLISANTIEG